MNRILSFGTGLLLAQAAAAQIGTPYCFGNSCPCGNDDAAAGCGNFGFDGDTATGALLYGEGSADVWFDDLVLTVSGIDPDQFGLVFMGDQAAPTLTADGLLCVGAGAAGLWRFPVSAVNDSGELRLSGIVAGSQDFNSVAWIDAGETFSFQAWYRDPAGPCSNFSNFSNALTVTFEAPGTTRPVEAQLGGRPIGAYPHFEVERSLIQGDDLSVNLDATRYPWLVGATGDLYIVAAKDAATWESDPSLVDVRGGGAQAITVVAGGVAANTTLVDAGTLNGTTGIQIGIGYDLVFDVDQDGQLGAGDLIDGLSDQAGVYVVRDTAATGPYTTVEVNYDGGNWRNQNVFYPSIVGSLGELPLMVVSHGNGHNFQWYDHIGHHMASYGWIVMSHQNNTGPGIETASETTLDNTDVFLGNLDTIAGGVLEGHVDGHNIMWIGHSRGGEGVARAYDRLFDADFIPQNYTIDDIKFVSSICPTVFFKKNKTHPHQVNYHLWVGSADADVWGAPNSGSQLYSLLERANGNKSSITVQGAGHGVFHNGGGSWVANGPCKVGPVRNHPLMFGYLLPLANYYVFGDPASKDFLWRQYQTFQPTGAPDNNDGCIVTNMEYHETGSQRFVIDNFELNPALDTSSSGRPVTYTVTDVAEGRLQDANTSLEWNPSDPFNGMTRAGFDTDDPHGLVFSWDQPAYLEFNIHPDERNWSDDEVLSFMACQGTRHPNTQAVVSELTFLVTLTDLDGGSSTIDIGAYGGGIADPYQRVQIGTTPGWANEFETIRIRVDDFLADGSNLNLARIQSVRFDFGIPGSEVGRLGFDSLTLHAKE
ncbi:MAG: hypothetical protein O2816_01660 [Planctomycetota bacterium]|nr:hypothetical protein [Planctomycetota bacterium]